MKLKKEIRNQKFNELQIVIKKEDCPKSNNAIAKLINVHPQTVKRWLGLLSDGKTLHDTLEQTYKPRIDKKRILNDDGTWDFIRLTVPDSVKNDYSLLDPDLKACLWLKINNAILKDEVDSNEPPLKEAEEAISVKISQEARSKWMSLNTFISVDDSYKKTGSKGASLCRSVIIPFLTAVL